MIVVLGPHSLAIAVAGSQAGELVVGAPDDERLAGDLDEAAEIAAVLPIPARACVMPAVPNPAAAVEAVRHAGGSLIAARIVLLGDPPPGELPSTWRTLVGRLGAATVADPAELAAELSREARTPAPAEIRAMRPGAPEAAAWREALRAAKPRRFRRRRVSLDRRPDRDIEAAIRRPLAEGCHSIAVISPKGGVGKTTLSFLMGSVLARLRADRVVVVDTNPDFGTLADLVGERVPATISDLLRDLRFVRTVDDLSGYVTATRSGMSILAAPQDPTEMARLGSGGYRAVGDLLRRFHDIVVFDCGTGFLDDITQFALRSADHVVLVTQAQLVSAKIVIAALERLAATGFDPSHVTLAVNMTRSDSTLDVRRLTEVLGGRVGAVVEVPFDARMQRDVDLGEFSYARTHERTLAGIRRLAAAVVERLPAAAPVSSHDPAEDDSNIPGGEGLLPGQPAYTFSSPPPSPPLAAMGQAVVGTAGAAVMLPQQ